MTRRILHLLALSVLALLAPTSAHAVSLSFACITGSDATCAIGESQLAVEVSSPSDGKVEFTFTNTGDENLVAAKIYWDDDCLLKAALKIENGDGVWFRRGGHPRELPGGDVVDFDTDFRVTAKFPTLKKGIGPGEELSVVFKLRHDVSFDDVIAALTSGDLRIGIQALALIPCDVVDGNDRTAERDRGHGRGHWKGWDHWDDGCGGGHGGCRPTLESASFVNVPVPEPSALLLVSLGLLGVAAHGRRRRA